MKTKSLLICVGLWLTYLTVAAAERPHFDSKGPDKAITVDGRFDDWYGHLQPFGTDPVAVQFLNDGEFLYVRLTASEPAARMQIVRLGMTIWFDPGGGTKKKFGVRYPAVDSTGADGEGRGRGGFGGFGGGGGGRGRRGGETPPPDDSGPSSERVDVLGPGKDDARSLTRSHLPGLDVAIHTEEGTLQYELKVPLARSADHPYAIETAPGKTIGVGLETGKRPQQSAGMGRGGGGMGGRGGRGGGNGRPGGFDQIKPLKSWATVTIGLVR